MKQASTTNRSLIFFGSLFIIIVAIVIALISDKDNNRRASEIEFIPLDGAIASSYEAPEELLIEKNYDTLIGDNKARLKVVVYEDYLNPYSANLSDTLEQLLQEYNGDLAILSRPFVNTGSSVSSQAALSYLCALDEGKGGEMRELLLDKAKTDINSFNPITCARDLNIDESEFASCLVSEEKLAKIEELKTEAKNNLVLGAPTILIADELIIGNRPYADFVDSNGDAIEGLKTVIRRHLEAEANRG